MDTFIGELPKLFDREFAMAFLLPVMIFIVLINEIANIFVKGFNLLDLLQNNLIISTTILGLVSWLIGILLLMANRFLYRVLEADFEWKPLKFFTKFFTEFEKNRYHKLINKIKGPCKEDCKEYCKLDKFPPVEQEKSRKLMIELYTQFPDQKCLILPTRFGNAMRASEVYPRVMYGIESKAGWSRMLTVIPKDYRDLMDNQKAHIDLWVNVAFLGIGLILEYLYLLGMAIFNRPIQTAIQSWWILVPIIIVIAIKGSTVFARNAVVDWGDYFKAAFDVYSPQLRKSLGFELPKNRKEEIKQWTNFSHAIICHKPKFIPELEKQNTSTELKRRNKSKAK